MTAFTKINARTAPDMAADFGMGDQQESRFLRDELNAEQTAMSWHDIKPGKRSPVAHSHAKQEELYVVVAGSGRGKFGDSVAELNERDVVRVAADTTRGFEAGDDGMSIIAFGAPVVDGETKDKGQMADVDEFWDNA